MTKIRERANGKGYDIEFDDPKKRAWTPTLYQAEALASCEGDGTWEVIHINEPYSPFLYWASSHPKNGGTWYLQWGEPIRFGDEMGFTITTGIDPGKDECGIYGGDPMTFSIAKDWSTITLRRGTWEKEFQSGNELVDWVWELMDGCNKSGLAEHSARELSDKVVRSLETIRERDAEIDRLYDVVKRYSIALGRKVEEIKRLHQIIGHLKRAMITAACTSYGDATPSITDRLSHALENAVSWLLSPENGVFNEWEKSTFPDEGD